MFLIDTREPKKWRRRVKKLAEKEGFEDVREIALSFGDYATEHVVVERKALMDLMSSIFDKRYSKQLEGLETMMDVDEKHGFLLVHGSIQELYEVRKQVGIRIDPMMIFGAISSIVARSGMQLIWVEDEYNAAVIMVKVMKKIEEGKWCKPRKRDVRKLMSRALGISEGELKGLLMHFLTLEQVALADKEELMEVFGIGPKKADEIWRIFHEFI